MTTVGDRLGRTMRRFALGAVVSVAAAALVVPSALASPESDATDAINQAWNAAGGADSVVGSPDGEVFQVGDGYGQKYSDGKIFFTPGTGAHLIYGTVLDKYESLGGPADSDLGFPNINTVAGLVSDKSRVSTFSASDKPAIFWTPDNGAWAVRGALNAAWDKLGGSVGQLGVPVEDETYDGDVVSQKFTGGRLSWNSKTNAFTSDPAGMADSLAGLDVPRDPVTMINLAWRASGGLGGPLGARQGALSTIGDNSAAQSYASGKIFYSPDTGAHAVTGAILSKYESLGGPTGDLGFPVGTEADGGVPNSRISSFSAPDKPVIFWTPDSGAIVVRGPINAAWAKLGGATGTLGVPTDEQTAKGDTVTQSFTGGELTWNKATKEFSSKPAELAAELSGLEMPDAVAQTPSASSSGGADSDGGGFRWWWLVALIPLLLLLGLMAMLAQRRSRAAGPDDVVSDRELFTPRDSDDYWPGSRVGTESRYRSETDQDLGLWSPQFSDESDEDAIDTAPTRIPTEADLAEPWQIPEYDPTIFQVPRTDAASDIVDDRPDLGSPGAGRHSTGLLSASAAAWRPELDQFTGSPRRHAADPWAEEVDAAAEDSVAEDVVAEVTFAEEVFEVSEEEPWRPAIHLPLADPFQAPEGYFIKGNTHSGLYYTPDSPLYENTLPEVWFASEEFAQANGFVKAPD